MKTAIVQLPSGRIVRGLIVEQLHSGPWMVRWAGMLVAGMPLLPAKLAQIEAGE